MEQITHKHLSNGVELGVVHMPERHAEAIEFRMLCGTADEPAEKLGVARIVHETIDKGTEVRDGRSLSNAFDEIGASRSDWVGTESTGCGCICLPEFIEQAVALHAEFLCKPTFPEAIVKTAVELTDQEISALEDDPPSLADKIFDRQLLGPVLGRNSLGERDTVKTITRDDVVGYWKSLYASGRMQVVCAGPVEADRIAPLIETHFAALGGNGQTGRNPHPCEFTPGRTHKPSDTEQEQIGIGFPSAAVTDADYPTQRVLLGVLSGGMSARLFTEVREKQGLAYDVHASHENPRGCGMIYVSASCKPDRADQTFNTLLREIERLSEDVTEDELDRAKTRIIARMETLADMTKSRRNALAFDLFHHGQPVPLTKRIDQIRAVTNDDLRKFLAAHPRDNLCIVTLGPTEIGAG